MGLLASIKQFKDEIVNNNVSAFSARFTFDVVTSIVDQVSSLPRVIYSSVTHFPTQQVIGQLLQTAVLEITPIVVANCLTDSFKKKNTYDYIEDESVENNIGLYYLCLTSVYLIVIANLIWQVNHQSKYIASSTILGIGAPAKLKSELEDFRSEICESEHCSFLRVAKGTARDTATYFLIELLTKVLSFMPWVGSPLSRYFSIMNSGQYILSIALPECFRHQCVFFQEYPGQVFGQGVGILLSTKGLSLLIEELTKLPGLGLQHMGLCVDSTISKDYYESFLFSLMLVFHMSLALHMRFPQRLPASEKVIIDPVLYIKSQSGNYFDTKLTQLKEFIIKKARQTSNKEDIWLILEQKWRSEKDKLINDISGLWPSLINIKLLKQNGYHWLCYTHLLPETFLSLDGLISHPVIGVYIAEWLSKSILIFDKIDEYKKYWLLRVVHQLFPQEFKGQLGKRLLGIPKEVVNFLFRVIYSSHVTMHLVHLEDFLKTLQLRYTSIIENPRRSPYGFFKEKEKLNILSDELMASIKETEENAPQDSRDEKFQNVTHQELLSATNEESDDDFQNEWVCLGQAARWH